MNIFINKVLFVILFILICLLTIWIGLKVIGLLLPFIIAYLLSKPLHAIVKRFSKTLKPIAALIVVVTFVASIIGGLAWLIYKGFQATTGFGSQLTSASQAIMQFAENSSSKVLTVPWQEEPILLSNVLIRFYDLLFSFVSDITNFIVNKFLMVIRTIPNIGLFIFFLFLSLYFFTKDHEKITAFLTDWIHRIESKKVHDVKAYALGTIKSYFKALLTLVSISFMISLISLSLLRVPFAPLIALLVAVVDFIPLIGPAIVFVPWIVFLFLFSEYSMAFALLIVYLATTLTRQILEPKIISSKIGANPLITIVSMYVTYRLIGVTGLILGPILVMIGLILKKGYDAATEKHEH